MHKLDRFRAQWTELEIEVVGMIHTNNESYAADDGVEPSSWDTIVIGRNPDQDVFDILELAEDVSKDVALDVARGASRHLFGTPDDVTCR
jgi:hypothetical protein